jgi:anti-anti-sigma factor
VSPTPDPETARFTRVSDGPVRRLAVAGAIDMATAPDLIGFLSGELRSVPSGGAIVVDLAGVVLLAAAGIHVLTLVAEDARAREVCFTLDPVSRAAARVLDLCVVDLYPRHP